MLGQKGAPSDELFLGEFDRCHGGTRGAPDVYELGGGYVHPMATARCVAAVLVLCELEGEGALGALDDLCGIPALGKAMVHDDNLAHQALIRVRP